MKKKGVNKELIKKIKEIYEVTEVKIRTKEGLTREFTVKQGLRH